MRLKAAGGLVFPVCAAWKPMLTEALGAMVALYPTFRAVTAPLDGEYVAFQPLVIACPLGSVNARAQPLIAAVPLLAMVMLAVRPVFQALTA